MKGIFLTPIEELANLFNPLIKPIRMHQCGVTMWGQVLFFAFAHANAIYTIALDCGRLRSFYKWAGEHGKISS